MSNWLYNYNNKVVNFKSINSGYYLDNNGSFIVYLRTGDGVWSVVIVPNITDNENIKKLNLVNKTLDSNKISKQYVDLLCKEFAVTPVTKSDLEVFNILTSGRMEIGITKSSKLEGRYISEEGSVIVDGVRYYDGDTLYKEGYKYVVGVDINGEGVLEVSADGTWDVVFEGGRFEEEKVYYIDYSHSRYTFKPVDSTIYAEYTNGNYISSPNELILNDDVVIERRLKASKVSEVRYWECFTFVPGFTTVINKSGGTKILSEGVLSSKATVTIPPVSIDYGDWLIPISKNDPKTGKRLSGYTYKKLRNIQPFMQTKFPTEFDASFYRVDGDGFKAVVVENYYADKTIQNKAINIARLKAKSYITETDIDNLANEFGYTHKSFKWGTEHFYGVVQPETTSPPTPHIEHGSGIKELIFSPFEVTSGSFKLDVTYSTYLKYTQNNDTISRGKAKLQLIKYTGGGGYVVVDEIFNIDYNAGNYWDASTYPKSTTAYNEEVGSYAFRLELEDTYQDTQAIYVKAKPSVTQYTTNSTKNYDNSSVNIQLIDATTGSEVVFNNKTVGKIVLTGNEYRECVRVVVPKEREYVVRIKLTRGQASEGGITNNGGSVRVDEGVIKYDTIEREYPEIFTGDTEVPDLINIIIPDPDMPPPEEIITDVPDGTLRDPYCWIDVIEVYEYGTPSLTNEEKDEIIEQSTCYPLGTEIDMRPWNIDEDSPEWGEFLGANNIKTFVKDDIHLNLYNPLDIPVEMTLYFDVLNDEDCEGIINYYRGRFEYWGKGKLVADGIEERPSRVRIKVKEYDSNHIVIGGRNGSYVDVHLKSKGAILKTIRVYEDGWTNFDFGNLYDYDLNEFDIEIVTHQMGLDNVEGYDLRSTFVLDNFNLFTSYELDSNPFNSILDFYINDEKKFTASEVGTGEQYFPVKKGLNKYKFVFRTNHWDYNWDYAEIPWIRLTNWICDDIPVVPYCEPGGGDRCVEALIGCVLGLIPRKRGCVIIKYIDIDTGEVIKQVKYIDYSEGYYTFHALQLNDFELVGESEKTVYVKEIGPGDIYKCSEVEFYYRRLYRECVWVYHIDVDTGNVKLKNHYYGLLPGEHTFHAVNFNRFRLVGPAETQTVTINYLYEEPEECKIIIFEYEYIEEIDEYLDCVWVVYRAGDEILATDYFYNLEPGEYTYYAKEFKGYGLISDEEAEVTTEVIVDPEECKIVTFEYRKIPFRCVIVKFIDIVNDIVLDTDYYYNLLPGEYTYYAKEFEGYRLVDDEEKTILVEEVDYEECEEVIFEYEPIIEGCAVGKRIWLFT